MCVLRSHLASRFTVQLLCNYFSYYYLIIFYSTFLFALSFFEMHTRNDIEKHHFSHILRCCTRFLSIWVSDVFVAPFRVRRSPMMMKTFPSDFSSTGAIANALSLKFSTFFLFWVSISSHHNSPTNCVHFTLLYYLKWCFNLFHRLNVRTGQSEKCFRDWIAVGK